MKPHEEWLFKAKQDIESSRILLQSLDPLFDISIYHTQQSAEKALKAFLSFHMKEIDKTHSLKVLLEKCNSVDNSFDVLFILSAGIMLWPSCRSHDGPGGGRWNNDAQYCCVGSPVRRRSRL